LLIHREETGNVGGALFVVLLADGLDNALAAQVQVDQVVHPLLALGGPAPGQIQAAHLGTHGFGQLGCVYNLVVQLVGIAVHRVQ